MHQLFRLATTVDIQWACKLLAQQIIAIFCSKDHCTLTMRGNYPW